MYYNNYFDKRAAAEEAMMAEEEAMMAEKEAMMAEEEAMMGEEEAMMAEEEAMMAEEEAMMAEKIEEDYAIAEEVAAADLPVEAKVEILIAEEVEPEIIEEVVVAECQKAEAILAELSGGIEQDAIAAYYGYNPYMDKLAFGRHDIHQMVAQDQVMQQMADQTPGRFKQFLGRVSPAKLTRGGKIGLGVGAATTAAGLGYGIHRARANRRAEDAVVEASGLMDRVNPYLDMARPYAPAAAGAGIGAGLGAGIGYGLGGGYGALAGAGIGALGGGAAGHYGYPAAADYMANRRLSAEDVVAAYYGDYPYFDKHAFSAGTVDLFPALGGAFYGSLLGTLGGAVASTPRNRRHNLRRNMLLGAGLGAVGGGLAGHYVIPRFLTDSVAAPLRRSSYAEHAGEGALAGGALGGVYGGLVGGPAGAAAGASLLAGTTAGLNTVEKALADNTLIRRYHGVDINDPNWHRPVNRDIQRFYST